MRRMRRNRKMAARSSGFTANRIACSTCDDPVLELEPEQVNDAPSGSDGKHEETKERE